MSHADIVTISPEIMSGAPVFQGTRVPIQNLLDHLKGGDSIDDFLKGFPSVSREQAIACLDLPLTQSENPWLAIAGKYADDPNWDDYQGAIAAARRSANEAEGICLEGESIA
jgi:uncharacterized protein (DUF433 family)